MTRPDDRPHITGIRVRSAASRNSRRRHAAALLASLALSFLGSAALAQDALLDQAAALIRDHDPATAYANLANEEPRRAGDPRYDYLLGISALDAGHVTRAIFALERLVALQPDNALARAELARALLAAGETERGRAELERARRSAVPAEAAQAIDRVLGVLDQVAPQTGMRFAGYVELGAGYDSNVNSATNEGQFAIPAFGGLLFTSAAESQRQHDWFATAGAGASAQMLLAPEWKAVVAANLRGNVNRRVHDMNTGLLDVTAGVTHTAGAQSQTLAVQSGTAWVDSRTYRTANGGSAQWQSQLGATSQASVFAQWSRQEYAGQAERNTDRAVIGLGYAQAVRALDALVYGSTYLADERARHADYAYFGHHALGARIGAEHRYSPASVVSIEWQHERRRYGGAEPLFDIGRQDRQDDLTLQLRWSATDRWQVLPQIRYTRAASNVVLYDYTRTVFQITARRDFQ